MTFRLLADAVLLLHLVFILFVIFGGLWALREPRIAWVHVPMFLWGATVNLMHWVCPLTPLEKRLRDLAGDEGYEGGFIAHYVGALIYPEGHSLNLGLILGVSALIWNAVVYAFVIWRSWHRTHS